MKLVNRYLAWHIRRRHERHQRWLGKHRVLLPRGPHHSTARNGTQAVPCLCLVAVLLLAAAPHVHAQEQQVAGQGAPVVAATVPQEPGGLAVLLGVGALIVYTRGRWSCRRHGTLFQRKRKRKEGDGQ